MRTAWIIYCRPNREAPDEKKVCFSALEMKSCNLCLWLCYLCLSVCPSVILFSKQIRKIRWTDSQGTWCWRVLLKFVETFQFLLNSDKSNGLLHENYDECLCASFWVPGVQRVRNLLERNCCSAEAVMERKSTLLQTAHIFEGIKQNEKYAPQLLGYFMRTFPTLLVFSDSLSSYSNWRNIFG